MTDRAVVDNFAYYLRVTGGEDPFDVEPLVEQLVPDLRPVRSAAARRAAASPMGSAAPTTPSVTRSRASSTGSFRATSPGSGCLRCGRPTSPSRSTGGDRRAAGRAGRRAIARSRCDARGLTMESRERAMRRAAELGIEFVLGLPERHVGARTMTPRPGGPAGRPATRSGRGPLGGRRGDGARLRPGTGGIGGTAILWLRDRGCRPPAAAGADWLTGAWSQAANLHPLSPAAAAVEKTGRRRKWMLDLLGLPADAGFGVHGGAGLGNVVALAAARHTVLAREGWDVEAKGLFGAPEITLLIWDQAHATLEAALQYLGLGAGARRARLPTDDQGRMRAESLRGRSSSRCEQADPSPAARSATSIPARATPSPRWRSPGGAAAQCAGSMSMALSDSGRPLPPRLRHLVAGVERADRWATDAHKWLNVGLRLRVRRCRGPEAHRTAMSTRAAYLIQDDAHRDGWEYVLDSSRRARGFTSTRPSARSVGAGCARWWSGAATSPDEWRSGSTKPPGSRC